MREARFLKHFVVPSIVALVLPAWLYTRLAATDELIKHPERLMNRFEIHLAAAAAPFSIFPWYYDASAQESFHARNDPFAEWQPGEPGTENYVHIPPWEPGLAIPLKLSSLAGHPPSMLRLVGIQLLVDVAVLFLLAYFCFRIGGVAGCLIGTALYASWGEAATAAAFPFYYYWPIAFSLILAGVLAWVRDARDKWGLLPALVAGSVSGTWVWFRGTALSVAIAVPILVGLLRYRRGKAVPGAFAALFGIVLVLTPSFAHSWFVTGSLNPRKQVWHDLFIGIGTRPNPYGIVHSDSYPARLIEQKYGIKFQSPGYEEALREEYLTVVRNSPTLIPRNLVLNFADAMRGWSLSRDVFRLHGWLWLTALTGIVVLARNRDPKWELLATAFVLWCVQSATLGLVGRPQTGYLWETMGISVLCGAAGIGVVLQTVWSSLNLGQAKRTEHSPGRFPHEAHSAFEKLRENHFWFESRRRALAGVLNDIPMASSYPNLEIGCGDGYLLDLLPGTQRVGTDLHQPDLVTARKRNAAETVVASGSALPFTPWFSLVCAFDVIEHVEDDLALLKNCCDLLRAGGSCVITVPAGPELWSAYDEYAGHYRRYTRKDLERLAEATGLQGVRVFPMFRLLRPLAWLNARLNSQSTIKDPAAAYSVTPLLNFALRIGLAIEWKVIGQNARGQGTSWCMIGRKAVV